MKIVSITTSVDYGPELRITLPAIQFTADHSIVATTPADSETRSVVRQCGAELVRTDRFYAKGADFNKSGVIRSLQERVRREYPRHWVLLVDADILLPRATRSRIEEMELNAAALYGMKRWDYATPEDFERQEPTLDYPHDHAGYFQLYHRKDRLYPIWSKHAGKCDYVFKRMFRERRFVDGRCHHLGIKSQNWHGRQTPKWLA